MIRTYILFHFESDLQTLTFGSSLQIQTQHGHHIILAYMAAVQAPLGLRIHYYFFL